MCTVHIHVLLYYRYTCGAVLVCLFRMHTYCYVKYAIYTYIYACVYYIPPRKHDRHKYMFQDPVFYCANDFNIIQLELV